MAHSDGEEQFYNGVPMPAGSPCFVSVLTPRLVCKNVGVACCGACLKVAAMEAWTCKRAEERKEGRVWSAKRPRWILDGEFTWERQGGDEGDVWFEHEKREGRFERFVKKARRR